nr:hypothetical protein [Staphylococcus delphini]
MGYTPISKELADLFYQLMSLRYEIHDHNDEYPFF